MSFSRTELERLLDPGLAAGVGELSLAEVRSRRAACQEVEVALSYLRRMTQGRLDIVHAEMERRSAGGVQPKEGEALADLVEHLPQILADKLTSPGPGRLPTLMAPDVGSSELAAELDAMAGPDRLSDLPALSGQELGDLAQRLGRIEVELSAQRRELHDRIDRFQAELVRRYQTGEATVDNLLR